MTTATAAAPSLPGNFGTRATPSTKVGTGTATPLLPSSSSSSSSLAAAAAPSAPSDLPRQASRSRTHLADQARIEASSSPSNLSPAVLPASHSWYYGQDHTGVSHSGPQTGESPLRRAGSLRSSPSPSSAGTPRPAGSSIPRRTPSQGDTERARERARVIRERRLSATSREGPSSSPVPKNRDELSAVEREAIYSPSPPPLSHNRPVGQAAFPSSSSSSSQAKSTLAPVEMQTFAHRTSAQHAGPSVNTSYPSSSAEPTFTSATTTTTPQPRARTRSNPTRYAPSGLPAAASIPLDTLTSSAMRSNRSHEGSTLARKGSTGSQANGSGSSHRVDGPSGLTASASTDSISSRGYPNGQQDTGGISASPSQRNLASSNTAKIASPASPPRKSSKSHKLTPKQLAKRKAEEANRRDREADEAAARAAAAAAAAASQDENGAMAGDVIGLRDTARPAHNGFDSPSDALDSDADRFSPLGKPRKLDYGEETLKHRVPDTSAKIPRSTSAFVSGTPSTSTGGGSGREETVQFRLPTSSSMSQRNGLAGPSKARSASEPPTSAQSQSALATQRGDLASRAATIDWDEMIPPAIARRLAQEELLRRDPLLRHQEGLIDTWDRDGLPLTQVEIQVLAQDAVRREEGGGGELEAPVELEEKGGDALAAPDTARAPPMDEIEMHDVRAQEEEREARGAMERQEEEMRRLRREDKEREEEEEARRRKLAEEQREAAAPRSSPRPVGAVSPLPDQTQAQPQPQPQARPAALQEHKGNKKAKADKEKEKTKENEAGCCAGCIVM